MEETLVNFDDINRSYEGDLNEHDSDWVDQKIREATRILFAKCHNAQRLLEGGGEGADLVKDILTRAVLRVVRDKTPGYKQETDGSYSYTKDSLTSSGNIWFPDNELELLGCGSNVKRRVGGTAKVNTSPAFASPRPRNHMPPRRWW